MQSDELTALARSHLADVLNRPVAPESLALDADMATELGLSSMNKVLFVTVFCENAGVDLTAMTEQDVASMRTLRDVIRIAARPTVQDGR